jgi:hypothetical protein
MDWPSIAQYVELCLGFVLVARLLSLRLHRVYRYFCVFLIADISGTLIWAIDKRTRGTPFHFDYRIAWMLERGIVWVFTLLTVYALLGAILAQLPGILKLSRRILNLSFLAAAIVGVVTALPEYRAAAGSQTFHDHLANMVAVFIVLDRVIETVALLALLCILLFLIMFPVQMSRNLVSFFSGFVVYFTLQASGKIALSLLSGGASDFVRATNMWSAVFVAGIFAYWTIFITKTGEKVPAKLHVAPWPHRAEDLLIAQLEAMNASLLRAARR